MKKFWNNVSLEGTFRTRTGQGLGIKERTFWVFSTEMKSLYFWKLRSTILILLNDCVKEASETVGFKESLFPKQI